MAGGEVQGTCLGRSSEEGFFSVERRERVL